MKKEKKDDKELLKRKELILKNWILKKKKLLKKENDFYNLYENNFLIKEWKSHFDFINEIELIEDPNFSSITVVSLKIFLSGLKIFSNVKSKPTVYSTVTKKWRCRNYNWTIIWIFK